MALGLTNVLMRQLVAKGWVALDRAVPGRIAYAITPLGAAARARLSRESLDQNVKVYSETRQRIRDRFANLSAQLDGEPHVGKRIVFFGADEVAEIGFVCIHDTDLRLVGVVDPVRTRFLGAPVSPPSVVKGDRIGEEAFDRLVVMSFADADSEASRLAQVDIEARRVFWL